MKKIVCSACGGFDLLKDGEFFVCQHCGVKYKIEEIKKMLVEGTVKIDSSDKLNNLYQLARRAKDTDDIKNASKYYEMILFEEPSSWEATFYSAYYKSMGCKIIEIEPVAETFSNSLYVVLELIQKNVKDEEKQVEACIEVTNQTIYFVSLLYYSAKNFYDEINFESQYRYANDWVSRALSCCKTLHVLGDSIELLFPEREELIALSVEAWKKAVELHAPIIKLLKTKDLNLEFIKKTENKIKKHEPSYEAPKTEACYIATLIYGSYNCSSLWTLRRYRDTVLKKTCYGRAFIKLYYFSSPKLMSLFGNIKLFKKLNKKILDGIVKGLQSAGIESTFYIDE